MAACSIGSGSILTAATSFALLISSPSASLAQDRAGPCPANVFVTNEYGLLRIKAVSPCRRNETVRVVYGTWEREARFSEDGVVQLAAPVIEAKGQVLLSYLDGSWSEAIPGAPAQVANALRITLQWDAPVDLNLHVVEPGGSVGGRGDAVAGGTPGGNGTMGRIDLEDDGKGVSPFLESYLITNPAKARELFSVHVENVTRGWVPAGDHCRGGQYAQVPITLVVWDHGQTSARNIRLPIASCNMRLAPAEYFIKIAH